MRRVRFIPPAAGGLLVTGARVALANFRFARSRQGQLIVRSPERIEAELRWLDVGWDGTGTQGDHAGAIAHLKRIGRLYPCFESETELRARREFRIRRGKSAVYDRAMLKLTPEQRAAAEAGGKQPHWRFRLSNRLVSWVDAISGRHEAKLPAVSDPIFVLADGTPAAALTAVVDDIADGITHVIAADEGDGTTGAHIDLLEAFGQDPRAVTFARLPVLGDTGRLAIRALRHDGIEAEALALWLGCGEKFNIRDMAAKPDPVALPGVNRAVLARRDFASVRDRLPEGATEPFWMAIRGHIELLTEARQWWDVVNGTIFPAWPEGAAALAEAARAALPCEPWNASTWNIWARALPGASEALRVMLTGETRGPDLAALLPLMGRPRVMRRLSGG